MDKYKADIHLMEVDGCNRALLWPKTKIANEWVTTHIGNDYEVFAQGIIIEPQLIEVLIKGLAESNLSYLIQRS